MSSTQWPGSAQWAAWQKWLFRFFCCYFLLYTEPWTWIEYIPGAGDLMGWYHSAVDWMVNAANTHLFKVYKELVPPNGSGDTSYNWTQVWLIACLSLAGCLIWSILDRKRNSYNQLAYWLRIVVRYFIIINCFSYGIIKVFAQQMTFPNLSLMSTPMGDYLPMRLSWIYMGYSTSYQQFSGYMEVLAGLLMLFRRTSTFGTLMAAGVFCNVMMMNLSYDIPVKLFSSHLFIMCLFLLSFESHRLIQFFLFNRSAGQAVIYDVRYSRRWLRVTRIVLKIAFVILAVVMPFSDAYERDLSMKKPMPPRLFKPGIYEVATFVRNGDTIPEKFTDTIRWKDFIFENGNYGSINTTDTTFSQRYHRGYFLYKTDTAKKTIAFSRFSISGDRTQLGELGYTFPDSTTIVLSGRIRQDSIYTILKRINRHYQLTERQFHWLSEYNR